MSSTVEPTPESASSAADDLRNTLTGLPHGDMGRHTIVAPGARPSAAPSNRTSLASYTDGVSNAANDEDPSGSNPAGEADARILLPLPAANINKSQTSIAVPDDETVMPFDLKDIPPEAEVTMANDNSFIETSSGAAAREMKRRFDEYLGVGKDVRSPYAITAFVNQHGKQMYRVGARDMSAPAASMEENEVPTVGRAMRSKSVAVAPTSSASTSQSSQVPPLPTHGQKVRRPRMSVHSFLPPVIFKNTNSNSTASSSSPPPSAIKSTAPTANPQQERSPQVRKLRKTRSIPNFNSPNPELGATAPAPVPPPSSSNSSMASGRPHAHSVSSADAWPSQPRSMVIELPSQDTFAEVMFKQPPSTGPPSPISSGGVRSLHSPIETTFDFNIASPPANARIIHPFGPSIDFDAPSLDLSSELPPSLPSPPGNGGDLRVREMQSFESGLTARAEPPQTRIKPGSSPSAPSSPLGSDRLPPEWASDDSKEPSLGSSEPPASDPSTPIGNPNEGFEPLPETSMHTRYSTALFDVLQNYKGLPALEQLNSLPNPTTIRMSLRDQETAVPRDDPRFVIWGYVRGEEILHDEPSPTTEHSMLSRRKSGKDKDKGAGAGPGAEIPYVRVNTVEKKVLVAATIERWIAQLTSEMDYDELLIFFLTYRTYISALDLGHLLICRFHWALGQPQSGEAHDEMVRRIVRVRTFVAIRYWLLTFFSVDFIPNRELRLLFADWLNTLRRDPILTRHKDAPSIVQKLRKVVLECKNSHMRGRTSRRQSVDKSQSRSPPARPTSSLPSSSTSSMLGDLSNGHFAESLRKALRRQEPDEDIDLDFESMNAASPTAGGEFNLGAVVSTNTSNPTTPMDLAMMRQPLHLTYLQYGKSGAAQGVALTNGTAIAHVPLPVPHSTISRVVVNAIGKLGRWRRVLNYRTTSPRAPLRPPLGLGGACVDASAFDMDASETGDLLLTQGGVEHYLKMHESAATARNSTRMIENGRAQGQSSGSSSLSPLDMPPPYEGLSAPSSSRPGATLSMLTTTESVLESVAETSEEGSTIEEPTSMILRPTTPASVQSAKRITSPNATSLQPPPQGGSSHTSSSSRSTTEGRNWEVDVVSIDDMDLSDFSSSDDVHSPPHGGPRKFPRRLPTRRDFEFVRHSRDSVSSMGIRTNDSVLSGTSSVMSSTSVSGADGGAVPGPIRQWQMDALVDSLSDDDESGDVEAALRRLEGQINQDKQKQKQSKVDNWVQSIRQRGASTSGSHEPLKRQSTTYSSGSSEDYGQLQGSRFASAGHSEMSWPSSSRLSRNSAGSGRSPVSVIHAPPNGHNATSAPKFPPGLDSSSSLQSSNSNVNANSKKKAGETKEKAETQPQTFPEPKAAAAVEAKPAPVNGKTTTKEESPSTEKVVSGEKAHHRTSSRLSSFGSSSVEKNQIPVSGMDIKGDTRLFTPPEKKLKKHRSFVLSHKSDVLCQHFSMIDRELFLNLKFEELVSQDWVTTTENLNVLDWGQFLRERARLQAEGVKTSSDLTVIRSRFNLMANFVASEIVLTSPTDRLMIYSKFIRIAWKAYCAKSFNTLVAILAGLDTKWVSRALRQANAKPGIWEARMLRDLQQWSTSVDDFKHIRETVEALAETKAAVVPSADTSVSGDPQSASTSRSRAASELKPPPPPACVSFFGIYLSQLHRFSVLPDLIDPTAPSEPVKIDPATNTFEPPSHPEVFSNLAPLPPSVQLEPLINVHKQRLVAGVVKSLVGAQHLAVKVQYPTEKKLFQKCLKLRGLDNDTLQRALAVFSEA